MSAAKFFETFALFRRALVSGPESGPAITQALGTLPDHGASWLKTADEKLRKLLANGLIEEAEQIGVVVGAVRRAQCLEEGALRHDPGVYGKCLDLLIQGARAAIASQEIPTGIQELLEVSTNIICEGTLRWAAWTWMTVASATTGDLKAAKTAADTALTIAGQLDIHARAVSQCARAGIGFLRGEIELAKKRLLAAIALFDELGDQREMSAAWLALGHILFTAGRERDALQAVNQALEVDQAWPAPAVFLARRAMISGRVDEAEKILSYLFESKKKPAEIDREMRLVRSVSDNMVPLSVATEYLWLRERPLTDTVVSQLVSFAEEHSNFFPLCETLAWDLTLAGYRPEAGRLFRTLGEELDIAPEIQVSVRRGLDYLKSHKERVVTPLQLIQERGNFDALQLTEKEIDSQPDPDIFWVRKAIMGGRLDEAEKMVNALAETTTRPAEMNRERELLKSIRAGTTPLSVVTEYLWIQERPLTDIVVNQVQEFAEEHRNFFALRNVIAWDLALGGYSTEATRQFRSLSEEMDLDKATHDSIKKGLHFLHQETDRIQDYDSPDTSTVSGKSFLTRFVCTKQLWPTVLDQHSLLFTGKMQEISNEVLTWTESVTLEEGQYIHRQGQPGWLLTFIDAGEANASRTRGTFQDFGSVQSGSFFGEIGTIWGLPNTTDIMATQTSTMMVLSREQLLRQVKAGSTEAAGLLKTLRSWYLDVVFSISPIFSYIDSEYRAQLTKSSKSEIFHLGETLIKQDKPSNLFMLISGVAQVSLTRGKKNHSLGFLCPGDLIGELDPSPVSVLAESTVTAISIDRSQLDRLPSRAREKIEQRLMACTKATATPEQIV